MSQPLAALLTPDLFATSACAGVNPQPIAPDAWFLPAFALPQAELLLRHIGEIEAQSPTRRLYTPGGLRMSVATTSCGPAGWVSDAHGYRYSRIDPASGLPWPAMPAAFMTLAQNAAAAAAYPNFVPDSCLINRYVPGARLGLHQDRNEQDLTAPIVSVSLGLPAMFLFGGPQRSQRVLRLPLVHGDVVVWGGASRMAFHGILPLAPGEHPLCGACRINLTFRQALAG